MPSEFLAGLRFRDATAADINFVVEVDLRDEGVGSGVAERCQSDYDAHRERLRPWFSAEGYCIAVAESQALAKVGLLMWRYRDLDAEAASDENAFLLKYLPRSLFPSDGKFTAIYQLWVDPNFRRRGLATRLKLQLEAATRRKGLSFIYTHTAVTNAHVIALNQKLGYIKVRTGPIWDRVVRVSMTKRLT